MPWSTNWRPDTHSSLLFLSVVFASFIRYSAPAPPPGGRGFRPPVGSGLPGTVPSACSGADSHPLGPGLLRPAPGLASPAAPLPASMPTAWAAEHPGEPRAQRAGWSHSTFTPGCSCLTWGLRLPGVCFLLPREQSNPQTGAPFPSVPRSLPPAACLLSPPFPLC